MNILEFIETQYPIKERVKDKLADPYKRIAEMDDLPYDKIGPDESGHITKLVEVDDMTYIPVLDLISYTKEDIVALKDDKLREVWEAYMANIDINDLNITDIMECVRQYKASSNKRRGQLNVLSV